MSDFCSNHLFVSGAAEDMAAFNARCIGYEAFYPTSREEFFGDPSRGENAALLEQVKIMVREQKAKNKPVDTDAIYEAAGAEIKKIFRKPTEADYQRFVEEERRKHYAAPPSFCFNALYPVPQEIIDKWGYDGSNRKGFIGRYEDPKNYTVDGRRWCEQNWGTYYDVYRITPTPDDECPDISGKYFFAAHFRTPWSPPYRWLAKVAEDFDTLRFELSYTTDDYSLYTKGFNCGMMVCENGLTVHGYSAERESEAASLERRKKRLYALLKQKQKAAAQDEEELDHMIRSVVFGMKPDDIAGIITELAGCRAEPAGIHNEPR